MNEQQPTSPDGEQAASPQSVLEKMLGAPVGTAGNLAAGHVASWAETTGTLSDGRTARLGASCLLRPAPGDKVLAWCGDAGDRWILAVLDRSGEDQPAVLATPGPLRISAPSVGLGAEAVHIQARDFITSTHNRHAVEHVRTETVHTRVAQVGTDIRRARHATDEVEGTVLHRAGMWISSTLREARLHARAFLFD